MKQVIVSVLKGMMFLMMWTFSVCLIAQAVTVRGIVKDTKGESRIKPERNSAGRYSAL